MKRILIVEDDTAISDLQKDYLEAHRYFVNICANGRDAIEEIKNNNYDLIILDIMLPDLSGFEVCKSIRNHVETPVIMLSAKSEDIDKIRGLGLGADDYLTKPFSPSELVARVGAHIARYERLTSDKKKLSDIIEINGLKINKSAYKVYVNDKEVSLTVKEYEVLLFLASNPNRVYSKDHIFDRIWGVDSMGEVATITVHVQRIREKIEKNPSKPQYIETVWGAGYRFRV